jgi:hypothetical protein
MAFLRVGRSDGQANHIHGIYVEGPRADRNGPSPEAQIVNCWAGLQALGLPGRAWAYQTQPAQGLGLTKLKPRLWAQARASVPPIIPGYQFGF